MLGDDTYKLYSAPSDFGREGGWLKWANKPTLRQAIAAAQALLPKEPMGTTAIHIYYMDEDTMAASVWLDGSVQFYRGFSIDS